MIQHILLAIVTQIAVAMALRSWAAGGAVASAWAISREITQAEYRWIEQFGSGLRANMPWWGGFDPAVWHRIDPWLDWFCLPWPSSPSPTRCICDPLAGPDCGYGMMAMILVGPPVPPLIFIGSAMSVAPMGGRRSRFATFSSP
jgi:hypothetical protein